VSTITLDQQSAITSILSRMVHLSVGVGDEERACSIAAINLALSGELTDSVPDCMSLVVGRWIIGVQDEIPDELRNSARWRSLLPRAAGTGRELEAERVELLMGWMWDVVLPALQPTADARGFGDHWLHMCTERTAKAAGRAKEAAVDGVASAAAGSAWGAAGNTSPAAMILRVAWVRTAAAAVADAVGWGALDPCELLEALIETKANEPACAAG